MGNYSCTLYKRLVYKDKVIRVMKIDGKVLSFTKPILVQDVLVRINYGVTNNISLSKEILSSKKLPLDYELKLGKVYYVIPFSSSKSNNEKNPCGISSSMEGGVKRIKIVITKQQLKELLNKKISMDDVVISSLENDKSYFNGNWKPKLESIPEE
ncbi:hypothetical protein F8388_006374 [Cannabis sativa]|uniref:Uncharacterized protein n=1 Tax=Cannabis sativa TaxID=3483 RepID=A0A7J6E050_CANSA|nr:hypothetical protein G4B88_018359 [Cannabis sativa]KAF4356630.1 hypothetical protein F8388_006374 [Cannabis sativa]